MNKGRVEAITDGIVAIAATIMVLELGVPETPTIEGLLDQKLIFVAYIISFFMIYTTWHAHHNLLSRAEVLTSRAFLINGLWLFFLTLVPFTTAWFGSATNSAVPAFLYALNLLLWSLAFHLLAHQIGKDNPGVSREGTMRLFDRIVIYAGYSVCLVLAFVYPIADLWIIGITTIILLARIYLEKRR